MNNWYGLGRLTRDPEMRTSTSGKTITNFTLAINRPYKDDNGEDVADFINCVAFDRKAEYIAKYIRKGNKIAVTGRLQTRTYEQNGEKKFISEIIVNEVQNCTPSTNTQSATQTSSNEPKNDHKTSAEMIEKAMKDEPSNFEEIDDDIFALTDDDLPF